jgi:hypothetical protein
MAAAAAAAAAFEDGDTLRAPCAWCGAKQDGLVGLRSCTGCPKAGRTKRVDGTPDPSNLGPLCSTCAAAHERQGCSGTPKAFLQASCDDCSHSGERWCLSCKRVLCERCYAQDHQSSNPVFDGHESLDLKASVPDPLAGAVKLSYDAEVSPAALAVLQLPVRAAVHVPLALGLPMMKGGLSKSLFLY